MKNKAIVMLLNSSFAIKASKNNNFSFFKNFLFSPFSCGLRSFKFTEIIYLLKN